MNNWNHCDCFLESKANTTTDLSINQRTVIQTYRVGPKRKFWIRHDWILSIRLISDLGKKCRIPSDSESVTYLTYTVTPHSGTSAILTPSTSVTTYVQGGPKNRTIFISVWLLNIYGSKNKVTHDLNQTNMMSTDAHVTELTCSTRTLTGYGMIKLNSFTKNLQLRYFKPTSMTFTKSTTNLSILCASVRPAVSWK